MLTKVLHDTLQVHTLAVLAIDWGFTFIGTRQRPGAPRPFCKRLHLSHLGPDVAYASNSALAPLGLDIRKA